MANRAYLFPTALVDQWDADRGGDGVYYDSRWTIPLAWWFLFLPGDVTLIDVCGWQEVRIRTDREAAIKRFNARRPFLDELIGERLDRRRIDFFEAVLAAWAGRFLVMDPNEILCGGYPGEDSEHYLWFQRILQTFGDYSFDSSTFARETATISPVREGSESKIQAQVVGYTYGALANSIWRRISNR